MTSATSPTSRTPLHHWHTEHGVRFATSGGWQLPVVYSTVERETATARTGLALADISAVAKIGLLGPGVSAAAPALEGNSRVGKTRTVVRLQGDPPVLACRLTHDHLLLLATTSNSEAIHKRLESLPAEPSPVRNDETTARAGFCLVGLSALDMLRHLVALDVSLVALPPGSCAETSLAGVHALLVRPADSSLPCVQIYVVWDLAEYVWKRLLDAGRAWGIVPVGWETLRSVGLIAF